MRTWAIPILLAVLLVSTGAGRASDRDDARPALLGRGSEATAVFAGRSPGAGFGASALAVGDVDGDRVADLLVGAPGASGTRGELYVFFGEAGNGPRARDLSQEGADLTIAGPAAGVRLGVAAAVVDLDADGAGEIAVTAGGFSPQHGRLASGGVLLLRGGPHLRALDRLSLETERADAGLADLATASSLGATLARGDFNADGYPDLAAGAPAAPGLTGTPRAGRVVVLFGGAHLPEGRVIDATSDPDVAVVGGVADGDGLGSDLAAGEVTGDRADDLVMGTPNRTVVRVVTHEKAGEVFVVAGGDALAPGGRVDLATTDATLRVLGSDYGDYLGRGVAAGDVTGDGIADVVAGAIDADGPGNRREPDCGEVYVVESTERATPRVDLRDETAWQWVIGDAPLRFLGVAVAAGDLDGDGRAEIVAAATNAGGPAGAGAGVVYLLRGAAGTVDLASGGAMAEVYGRSPGAALGTALLVADLDGDGVRDVVAGAPGASGGRGEVLFIRSTRAAANAPPVLAPVGDVAAPYGTEIRVAFHATDADGDPVRFGILNRPPGAQFRDEGDGSALLDFTRAAGDTTRYEVTVTASDGQHVAEERFEIGVAEGAAPRVTRAVYKKGALRLRGDGFRAGATVVLNDVASPVTALFKPAKGRLVLRGSRDALGLSAAPGENRVVVVVDGVPSPPFVF